jgi:DNA integrity scanning protein DisA with diadenylate cyclase activity
MRKIYTIGHLILATFIGCVTTSIILGAKQGLEENRKITRFEQLPLSKCDSLVMTNDSLVQRLEIANRRVQQYKIGLWFLRDKDKKAYDYVINAGNLNFQNEWQ